MPRYSGSASKDVEDAMHKWKRGKLKSSSGKKVEKRNQAIAIGRSEACSKVEKAPPRKKAVVQAVQFCNEWAATNRDRTCSSDIGQIGNR